MSEILDHRRIAKNTLFLYFRMFLLMLISFYSSRLLLKSLGVIDFGVYDVVGSIVGIFSSLRGFLTSSTQRFLNYEFGRNNHSALNGIFSMSIYIHLIIGAIFLFIVIPIGLYLIPNVLNIPNQRMFAAEITFIFSVLSVVITLLTVPYESVILAYEKMHVYAILSILDAILRLLAIVILFIIKGDNLIIYSIAIFIASLLMRIIFTVYCKRNYNECKAIGKWDNKIFKELGTFAGWQMLGNTGYSFQIQGLNMVLNVFWGPIFNAARSVANQVNLALGLFISNMMLAVNPQITKLYGNGEYSKMMSLFFTSSKLSIILFSCISLPILISTSEILDIWLGTPPALSSLFLKLLIIYSFLRVLHQPIDSILKATGKIALYQIFDCLTLLLSLPITYILFKYQYPAYTMYFAMIFCELLNLTIIIFIAKKVVELSIIEYLGKVVLPFIIISIDVALIYYISPFINIGLYTSLLLLPCHVLIIYLFILNKDERKIVKRYILRN